LQVHGSCQGPASQVSSAVSAFGSALEADSQLQLPDGRVFWTREGIPVPISSFFQQETPSQQIVLASASSYAKGRRTLAASPAAGPLAPTRASQSAYGTMEPLTNGDIGKAEIDEGSGVASGAKVVGKLGLLESFGRKGKADVEYIAEEEDFEGKDKAKVDDASWVKEAKKNANMRGSALHAVFEKPAEVQVVGAP